jgi:hypothetical protein
MESPLDAGTWGRGMPMLLEDYSKPLSAWYLVVVPQRSAVPQNVQKPMVCGLSLRRAKRGDWIL